jgi:hypothetical protein
MGVRVFGAMVLSAGLSACAGGPQPAASVADFQADGAVGRRIEDAIAVSGPPTLQWDLADGRRAYQWQESSVTARVASPSKDGAVIGAASQTTCYYTLYTRADAKGLRKIVGYEPPRPGCGRVAMNR